MSTIMTGQIPDLLSQDFKKIFGDEMKNVEPQFDKIYQIDSSTNSYEKLSGVSGLGNLSLKDKGAEPKELKLYQKYDKTFTHDTYAGYTRIEKEAYDDDRSGQLRKIPSLQAIAARQTLENVTAAQFDRSQNASYTGPDGKVMCATDHPRSDGSTWTNRPSINADLAVGSLQSALSEMRTTVDDFGNRMTLMPTILLIPPELEWDAIQLLENADKAGVATRDTNAIKTRGLKYMVWDYLTDTDAWYLLTPKEQRQLLFFWREKINTQFYMAPDNTLDAIHQVRYRVSHGWVDTRGIYGSIGA